MKQNLIKNLGISIFSAFVVGYSLIMNFSLIGLAGASLAVGAILLTALVYNKKQSIVEKVDIYILFIFLGILAIHYEKLLNSFSLSLFTVEFSRNALFQILSLIAGILLGLIFYGISRGRDSLAAEMINKYIGLFLATSGISFFFWSELYLPGLVQQLLIFTVFGLIAFCRANRTTDDKAIGRLSYISFFLAIISLILSIFFLDFSLSPYNFSAFLSVTVFPWYSVLGITLILMSIVGIGFYYGDRLFDEDTIFLTGIVGLIWVVKSTVYYFFDFSWIAICVYVLLFLGFMNRFIKRKSSGEQTGVHFSLKNNEFYWLFIAAISVVLSVLLIHNGYIYFWLSLIIGLFTVFFLNKIAPGWMKDAIFWISLLFCIAGAACTFTFQNGYNEKKTILIAALFVFSSVIMWMMNHKNRIGQNKFKNTKITMIVIFTLLVAIPALKAGSDIGVAFEKDNVNIGSLVQKKSDLLITTTANGKDNKVTKLNYVWAKSFSYDSKDILESKNTQPKLKIENHHLIIWAEDSYGVVTRSDHWFYDGVREKNFLLT